MGRRIFYRKRIIRQVPFEYYLYGSHAPLHTEKTLGEGRDVCRELYQSGRRGLSFQPYPRVGISAPGEPKIGRPYMAL